ncbi:helix-turn-helix domain-containing protein [Periweissella fabalis]|uniref:Helicase Helix-turn-helix domain-containing protein n=1 Tax=Periweissella fabalis TaxID=1070421 RepID=A0A7X6S1S6_9LACO|nr:helix-turn-helix domain-containing protein [Periweissella fabalis]MCM0599034.1 helix-turn-helix domain-containing protein [Periweissella fabalis]NKZ23314.1 hypothetical protein [Periweissella fabalis]
MITGYMLTKLNLTESRRAKVFGNIWQGGAQTVSTSFWGLVYDVLPETGLFENTNIEKVLKELQRHGLIKHDAHGLIQLTSKGATTQAQYQETHYIPKHLAINQNFDLKLFRDLFLLANQTISELAYHNARFYPYQIDLQAQWQLKHWLKMHPREVLITQWSQELQTWLATLSNEDAQLFAQMLFGHDVSNALFSELPIPDTWTEFDWQLWQLDQIAALMTVSLTTDTLIKSLILLTRRSLLSNSANISVAMWQENHSLKQIAQQRQIKPNTVREHILQAAILQRWSVAAIEELIPDNEQSVLADIYRDADLINWDFKIYAAGKDPRYFTYFRLYQLLQLAKKREDMDVNV